MIDSFVRIFPTPRQVGHSPPRGTVLPDPAHSLQVLAIWKPPSRTKVREPEPPQAEHCLRWTPSLRPVAEQVVQSATGVMVTFFFVPLQASRKLIVRDVSMSSPRPFVGRDLPPPPAKDPNSCSNKSPPRPSNWNPENPPFRPKPAASANAFGSNPGVWDAAPYWSKAARFFSSLRIWKQARLDNNSSNLN